MSIGKPPIMAESYIREPTRAFPIDVAVEVCAGFKSLEKGTSGRTMEVDNAFTSFVSVSNLRQDSQFFPYTLPIISQLIDIRHPIHNQS